MSQVYLNSTIRRRQSASEKGSLRSSCIFVLNFFIASYDIDPSTSCRARVPSRLSAIKTAKKTAWILDLHYRTTIDNDRSTLKIHKTTQKLLDHLRSEDSNRELESTKMEHVFQYHSYKQFLCTFYVPQDVNLRQEYHARVLRALSLILPLFFHHFLCPLNARTASLILFPSCVPSVSKSRRMKGSEEKEIWIDTRIPSVKDPPFARSFFSSAVHPSRDLTN